MDSQYMVVAGVSKDKKQFRVALFNDVYNLTRVLIVGESDILGLASQGTVPLNFSVNNGRIVQDWGDFSRLNKGAFAVILAEISSSSIGKVIGYRIMGIADCSTKNVTKEKALEIAQLKMKANYDEPVFQNAIVRNGAINNYPGKTYKRIVINSDSKSKPLPKDSVVEMRKEFDTPKPKKAAATVRSDEQMEEIALCRRNGIDPKLLSDPKLSKEQMRVLWVSKKNGAYAEAFASSKYPSDVMKFYADRIMSKESAEDCELLLSHPELSLDQVSELYLCQAEGIDYKDLIGKSSQDVMIERETRTREYWADKGIVPMNDDASYYMKALGYAMKERRG